MDQPVKIIHVIKRLEAIDRDLVELREMKRRLARDRAYFDGMTIAFESQINKLLNERVKLMELRVANPPDNLVVRDLSEGAVAAPDATARLVSPTGQGPVLAQSAADSLVAQVKAGMKKKQPIVLIQRGTATTSEIAVDSAARPALPAAEAASEVERGKRPTSAEEDDGLRSYKF